jgi:hypothetical protein
VGHLLLPRQRLANAWIRLNGILTTYNSPQGITQLLSSGIATKQSLSLPGAGPQLASALMLTHDIDASKEGDSLF